MGNVMRTLLRPCLPSQPNQRHSSITGSFGNALGNPTRATRLSVNKPEQPGLQLTPHCVHELSDPLHRRSESRVSALHCTLAKCKAGLETAQPLNISSISLGSAAISA